MARSYDTRALNILSVALNEAMDIFEASRELLLPGAAKDQVEAIMTKELLLAFDGGDFEPATLRNKALKNFGWVVLG